MELLRVFIAVKPFPTATWDIAVSRDFCVFRVLEAARGEFEETLVGIKVVYGAYKHFRSVQHEKWSYYGYLIAVKPFLTATFLDITVSFLVIFAYSVFWRPLDAKLTGQ